MAMRLQYCLVLLTFLGATLDGCSPSDGAPTDTHGAPDATADVTPPEPDARTDAAAPPDILGADAAPDTGAPDTNGDDTSALDTTPPDGYPVEPVVVAVAVPADRILTEPVVVEGPGGVRLSLPISSALLPEIEGADAPDALRLELGSAEDAPPDGGGTVVAHVRLTALRDDVTVPHLILGSAEDAPRPTLSFPFAPGDDDQPLPSLYVALDDTAKNGVGWTFVTRPPVEDNRAIVPLYGTGHYALITHSREFRPPLLGRGFELTADSPAPVMMVKLTEEHTSEIVASMTFFDGETGPFVDGPPDRRVYLWLEPLGAGHRVHVRSEFANRPIIEVASMDGALRPVPVVGPLRVDRGGLVGDLIPDSYEILDQRFLGAIHVRANANYGDYRAMRRDTTAPLRAAMTAEGRRAFLDWARTPPGGGFVAKLIAPSPRATRTLVSIPHQMPPAINNVITPTVMGRLLLVDMAETWTDPATGLMWQNQFDVTGLDWLSAVAYCDALDWGGYTDWRLPAIWELRSLFRGCPGTLDVGGACGVTADCLDYDDCYYDRGCSAVGGVCAGEKPYVPDELATVVAIAYRSYAAARSVFFYWSTSQAWPDPEDAPEAATAYVASLYHGAIQLGNKTLEPWAVNLCVRDN
jgi:hypothetical protein